MYGFRKVVSIKINVDMMDFYVVSYNVPSLYYINVY